ncbi:hypothetical protein OROGR_029022 [Orobanche gracilis]
MDWFAWLSKTGLDPSLVYKYGSVFAYNQLEQDDVSYFNHEFLQSMGISIAKHRLEILKLSRRETTRTGVLPRPLSRILNAARRTKRRISKYLRAWTRRGDSAASALAIVPRWSYSGRRKESMSKRNKRLEVSKTSGKPLLLTNGSPMLFGSPRINSSASPDSEYEIDGNDDRRMMDGDYDEYWSSPVKEIRWDTMFQNLKPT